jgi:hypothetical protein
MSLNPAPVLKTTPLVLDAERRRASKPGMAGATPSEAARGA